MGEQSAFETHGSEPSETVGYAAAMDELELILARLDDDRLDIDQLAGEVARAADLIAACRIRLDAARLRVTEIVADLEESTAE